MNRRRSTRRHNFSDASFQIPRDVNATANLNDLLLDDDSALEHDFFGDVDYTLSTPAPTRTEPPDSDHMEQYPLLPQPQSDQLHDGRVFDPDELQLTPTPRLRGPAHGLGRPRPPSSSPAGVRKLTQATPVQRGSTAGPDPLCVLSPSASSRAPPPTRSTPVATAFASRSDRILPYLNSLDPQRHDTRHEYPAEQRVPSHEYPGIDSRIPDNTHFRDPGSSDEALADARAGQLSLLPGRQRPSQTRGLSPSSLSPATNNAVTLFTSEDADDSRDRGEEASIPKRGDCAGPATPDEKTKLMTKKRASGKIMDKGRARAPEPELEASSSSSTVGPSRAKSKAMPKLKTKSKRSGDSSGTPRGTKRRKPSVGLVNSEPKPSEDEGLRVSDTFPTLVISSSASASTALLEVHTGNKDADTGIVDNAPRCKTAITEDVLPRFSPPTTLDPAPVLAISSLGTGPALAELSEGTDEVENFLSRYAQKYGPGTDIAVHLPFPEALSVVGAPLEDINDSEHAATSTAPERREAQPESIAPEGKRIKIKSKRPPTETGVKVRPKPGAAVMKGSEGRQPYAKITSVHSAPSSKSIIDNLNDAEGSSKPRTTGGRPEAVPGTSGSAAHSLTSVIAPTIQLTRPASPASQVTKVIPVVHHITVDTQAGPPVSNTTTSMVDPSSTVMSEGGLEEPEGAAIRELPPANLGSTRSSTPSAPPEPMAASPEPPKIKANVTGNKGKQRQVVTHESRPPALLLPKRPPAVAVTKPPEKSRKASAEPRGDDMFERKKRDNYLQKGLDLTAHSTRRFAQKSRAASATTGLSNEQITRHIASNARTRKPPVPKVPTSGLSRSSAVIVPGPSCSTETVSEAHTYKQKHDAGTSPSQKTVYNGGLHTTADSLNSDSRSYNERGLEGEIPSSSLSRSRTQSQPETGLEGEDLTNESSSSIGNVIAERLVHFSQRIMGSFGLLSSQTAASRPSLGTGGADVASAHLSDPDNRQSAADNRGHDVQHLTSPLLLSELSPRKQRQPNLGPTHDDAAVTSVDNEEEHQYIRSAAEPDSSLLGSRHSGRDPPESADGLYISRKRPAGDEKYEATADCAEGMELGLNERNPKRTKLSHGSAAAAAGSTVPHRRQVGGAQRMLSSVRSPKMRNGGRGLLASSRIKATTAAARRVAVTRKAEMNGSGGGSKGPGGAERSERLKNSRGLTVPTAPTFSGVVTRQQQALANSEREHGTRQKKEHEKGKLSKSDGAVLVSSLSERAPLIDKQTNDPPKATVPHAFRFETDTRSAARRQEFEEKVKTWEKRAASSAGSSQNGRSSSHKSIPDFKSLHATQGAGLASMAVHRRELVAPTVPVSPHFLTDIRLAEREKFEEARRLREREIEQLMEEKRRTREEEEEREWREARKRTVPRANAVPEWYADAPKRTAQG
ncbi:hypothetical protein M0805_004197 [Coniferiporia weirii]|nr:hypothetical protein M0805_004197 [Coniferiporia weirii]